MRIYKICAIILSCLSCGSVHAALPQADFKVIPIPNSIELLKDSPYVLTKDTKIVSTQDSITPALLARDMKVATGLDLSISPRLQKKETGITLVIDPKIKNPEGYLLKVGKKGITISASTRAGLFYGAKTLAKSMPQSHVDSVEVPAALVKDEPRFAYRGMLLDCGRHFFNVNDVKTFIDMMALHNMNRLHWHLTEDQGWRFEVKKHPVLTEVGSKRRGTEIGWECGLNDSIPHVGYYTQADCRDIIEYAAARNITVIPEIDIPGHTTSFLACFPETGCTGGPYKVSDHWGVHQDIVCAGNDRTFELLEDVFDEVCEVFPSEYINIGGDEAPKVRWEACPKCQERIKKENIVAQGDRSAESSLQGWFSHKIQDYLKQKGRKVIGWNEIAESGTDVSAAIMNRYDNEATKKAVEEGRDVIVNTTECCYFDYPQRSDLRLEPKLFPLGYTVGLSKTYSLEPMPEGITEDQKKHVMGVQGNVWGEFINRMLLVQYQSLPRMAAICEVGWSNPEQKDFKDFLRRLKNLRKNYDSYGYTHCAHVE